MVPFEPASSLAEARNRYLELAKNHKVDWAIVSDPDEVFSVSFWKHLATIIDRAETRGRNILGVRCDEQLKATAKWPAKHLDHLSKVPSWNRKTNLHKELVFRVFPDLKYVGIGKTGGIHETWYSDTSPWVPAHLPPNDSYTHTKSGLEVWLSASRNVYVAGGGMNVGNGNPLWTSLREIFGGRPWPEVQLMVESRAIPKRVLNQLIEWMAVALRFSATDYGIESRQFAMWVAWHYRRLSAIPKLRAGLRSLPQKDVRDTKTYAITKTYIRVMGRWPDKESLDRYVDLVLTGQITEGQLAYDLKSSPEYSLRNS